MRVLNRMQFPVECGTVYLTETDNGLVLSYRVSHRWRHICTVLNLFAIVSFTFAMGGSIFPLMLALPLVAYALYSIQEGEKLRLGPKGVDYERGLLIAFGRRHVPVDELKNFESQEVTIRENSRLVSHHCLCIATTGRPMHFAAGMVESEARELADVAKHFYQARLPALAIAGKRVTPNAAATSAPWEPDPPAPVLLRPQDGQAQPPTDSRFRLRNGGDTVEFGRRCRWHAARVRGLFFLNVPINGLLALMLSSMLSSADPAPLLLWIALSPLFAAGATLLAWLLLELSAPAWHRVWRFGPAGAACGYRRFGLPWLRRFPLPTDDTDISIVARLVLCKRHSAASRRSSSFGQPRPEAPFAISIVQRNEVEWLRIEGLTEGEARWVAGVLFTRFSQWFASDSPPAVEDAAELSGCPVDRAVAVALQNDGLLLSYQDRQPGHGCALLLALLAWSIPCLVMAVVVCSGPGLGNVMVAGAFFTVWLMIAYQLVIADRIWEYARLNAEGLAYRRSVWWPGMWRRVPLGDLKSAYVGLSRLLFGPCTASSRPPRRENCLVFDSWGQPTRFAAGITGAEAQWLTSVVNRYLETVRPADEAESCLALPADSPMRTIRTATANTVVFRGHRQARLIARTTLATILAAGLVGGLVFWPPWHWSVLMLPIFIWPVLGILAVFIVWFASVTAPAWSLAWTFERGEVTQVYRAFGLTYRLRHLVRATEPEVCRFEDDRRTDLGWGVLCHPLLLLRPEAHWGLRFLKDESGRALVIDGLTEGEARWIATTLPTVA